MPRVEKLGNVFYRVGDMDAAVTFYRDLLGLPLKLRDGDRWAAFDVAGATLALEGPTASTGSGATASLKVADLDGFVTQLRAGGASVGAISTGAHERRAELRDPSGNTLVLYEPLPR